MSEEETEQAVLKYLSSASDDEYGPFRSLTTLFEKVVGPSVPHTDSYDVEDEIESKEALRVVLDQMVSDGLLESRWGERDYEANYRVTDQGSYEAAEFDQLVVDRPLNALLTESGDPMVTESGDFLVLEDAAEAEPTSVDSSTWTGLTTTIVDARNAKAISNLIGKALDSLSASQAGNFENMQATAYLKAARELLDAPEPPSEEIWRLISRAADIVGLVSVFYAIFAQAIK